MARIVPKFLNLNDALKMTQIATPANPSAGNDKLYFKSDNNLYSLTSAGLETLISAGISGTEWKNDLTFTPSAGFGTIATNQFYYRRVGDTMEVRGFFTFGTVAASAATITLPSTYSIDTTKVGNENQSIGTFQSMEAGGAQWNTGGEPVGWLAVDTSAPTKVYFTIGNSNATSFPSINVSSFFSGSGNSCAVNFSVPISGWTINNGTITPLPAATNTYFSGYMSNATFWNTTSASFVDPTISGSNALTTRISNGITVTAGASNVAGITFTPANSGAVYMIKAQFGVTSSTAGSYSLTDGTTVIEQGDCTQTSGNYGRMTFNAPYAPGTTSPVTVKIQVAVASAGTAYILAAGSIAPSIEWSIVQIK